MTNLRALRVIVVTSDGKPTDSYIMVVQCSTCGLAYSGAVAPVVREFHRCPDEQKPHRNIVDSDYADFIRDRKNSPKAD